MAKAQRLATVFAGISSGIGVWYAVAPKHFLMTIGAQPTRRRIIVTRLVAAQEAHVGRSLLLDGRATRWMAMRVAGDALHGAMLALAYRSPDIDRPRMRAAFGAWLGITAADIAATAAARRIERTGVADDEPTGSTEAASALADGAIHRSVTINRSPDEVYAYWRDLENLPRFMKHLEAVEVIDQERSRWTARAPLGATVEWEARITADEPGRRMAWESTEKSMIWNAGEVRFEHAPGDRGTEVHVRLDYAAPFGAVGRAVARVLGEEPANQLSGDLRRLKQVLETGEVVVSTAVVEGKSRAQRPAQPIPVEA